MRTRNIGFVDLRNDVMSRKLPEIAKAVRAINQEKLYSAHFNTERFIAVSEGASSQLAIIARGSFTTPILMSPSSISILNILKGIGVGWWKTGDFKYTPIAPGSTHEMFDVM